MPDPHIPVPPNGWHGGRTVIDPFEDDMIRPGMLEQYLLHLVSIGADIEIDPRYDVLLIASDNFCPITLLHSPEIFLMTGAQFVNLSKFNLSIPDVMDTAEKWLHHCEEHTGFGYEITRVYRILEAGQQISAISKFQILTMNGQLLIK